MKEQKAQNKLQNKLFINKQIFVAAIAAFCAVLYFLYYTIFGQKGVITYFDLRQNLQEKQNQQNILKNQRQEQQNMVDGMRLDSLDLDLLDEEARKNLGHALEDEIIIYNKDSKNNNQPNERAK
jgi:cell division protein FtsB